MGRAGVRAEWSTVPTHIRAEVEEIVGARIVAARNLDGGFSPGPAARCDLDDGGVVFVKAGGTSLNPHTPQMHRSEAQVLRALPHSVPAPRLLGVVDDGDWVALVIEWVAGSMPVAPLGVTETRRIVQLVERLSAEECPENEALLPLAVRYAGISDGWASLATDPLDGLDAWTLRHLGDLARLAAEHDEATAGSTLVHMDLRSDNVLLADTEGEGGGDDVIVDWAGACRGADWIDLVGLLPSLHLDGGPPPAVVFAESEIARRADRDAVNAFLASLAGYFTLSALQPAPPGLPTLRPFQAAQGQIVRAWLAERMNWT